MRIGNREFETKGHTYIMGILNVTPDSFSDGGTYQQIDKALCRAEEMIAEGVDVIDLGGESTRPGYTTVPEEEEIARVIPLIKEIKSRFDIPVSLDTYKSRVAQAGIEAGADLVNDIWGLRYDDSMAAVIAAGKIPCCLMQNREQAVYSDFIADVMDDLRGSVTLAKTAGIARDQIVLDPGVGFGKTYGQNLETIRRLGEFRTLGYPVLLGASRKSVVGLTLQLPVDQRLEGTLATTVFAVQAGCMFVRVHDVRENKRAVQMTEALLYGEQ